MLITRTLQKFAIQNLKQYPVITITGPRQSGKTTLARMAFPEKTYVNLEDMESRSFAIDDPKGFLKKHHSGAIIDEFQNAPELASYIQVHVDESRRKGLFCLTGSRQFEVMNLAGQSLAGRTAMLRLLPFTFSELSHSTKKRHSDEFLFSGFYPRIYSDRLDPARAMEDYITTYLERDLRTLSAIQDLHLFQKFMKLLAGRIGQILNVSSLASDCGASHTIITRWISLLETSYIIFLLQPYHGNISKRLIKSPKVFFFDTGLAAHLLGIEKREHLEPHPLRGNLFENMVIADILKERFHHGLRNNCYFYRDSKGNEIDLCYETGHRLIIVEIKSGATITSEYMKGLNRFSGEFPHLVNNAFLVYNGDTRDTRSGITICGPDEIARRLINE